MTKDTEDRVSSSSHRSSSAEVLEQRLYNNENNLKTLADDTSRQIRELATNTSQQINGLANQIGKLDNSLQERGKIQWPAFSLLLGAITVISALAYWPINSAQIRMETAITKLADSSPTYRELDAAAKRRDDWQNNSVERFKRIETDMDAQQKAIVPRGEHEEKWRGADIRFADHQRQIDTLRTNFEGLYSPRDALSSMQRRLEDLERRLIRAGPQS